MPKKLTQEEFINSSKEIHGEKYSYHLVNYINTDNHVDIWCNRCQKSFPQTPYKHTKRKQGCRTCSELESSERNRMTTDEFLDKANNLHNFKFTYINVDFKNGHDKVKWQCNDCDDIKEQTIQNHLQGKGCQNCYNNQLRLQSNTYQHSEWERKGLISENFVAFQCYEIKCTSKTSDETFYKIGKTFTTLKLRFKYNDYPFTYETIRLHTGTAKEMSELEVKLKRKNKDYKYLPALMFGGRYECFSKLL